MDKFYKTLAIALEFLLYALLTAFALHATWLTWPDAYIDFSRELYLPWRVACGDVLYRDLAYDFGPLSVYLNAALFALLGRPFIHALFALNFALWLVTLLALRALLRRLASPAVTALAVSLFILLFSFNRYLSTGNFNYLAPYSHELPRGFLLALLALLALDSAFRRRSAPLQLLSGFLLGLVLFTKPEIALAAVSASATLFLVHFLWGRGRPARDGGPGTAPPFVGLFALGVLAALVAVLLPLSIALHSFPQALRQGLLKLYLDCFNPALAALPFYRNIMGVNEIPANVFRLLAGAFLTILPFFLARLVLPRTSSRPLRVAAIALLALLSAAIGFLAFYCLNSALPFAPVLFAVFSLWKRGRPTRDGNLDAPPTAEIENPDSATRLPLALAFAVFALALVSKVLLHAAIAFYGFVLALPSFCCAVLLFFRSPRSHSRTAIAAALLVGFSAMACRIQAHIIRTWDIAHPVMDDAFLAPRVQAEAFNAALDWIRANTPSGSTLAVLPEGAVLNVLSGRPNSTPYVYLSQGDWLRFGESSVLAAYSNSPPDTLVLVRKLESGQFGLDYAQSLMALLDPFYAPALTLTFPTASGPIPCLLVATRVPSLP